MRFFLVFMFLLGIGGALLALDGYPDDGAVPQEYNPQEYKEEIVLESNKSLRIAVKGQGVAPTFAISPAQAYVLAKRAATVEAYRLIAERVNGVRVEGQDTIKNMVVKNTTIRANVSAMIRNAMVVETTFKDGLCEVEMEITLNYNQFKQ